MIDKVVHVSATQCAGNRLVDIRKANAKGLRFFLVDFELVLRRVFQTIRAHTSQHIRVFCHHSHQLITCEGQLLMPQVCLVD
ncbi:hypothetical protein D3C75_687590 [compost metagenome]